MSDKKKDNMPIKTIRLYEAGRPKEDLSSLPVGWKEEIIDMYCHGAADKEIMATIWQWRGSFSLDLWKRWLREEEEFRDTIEIGRIISEAWWSKFGRENLKNSQFNNILYIWRTKNQFKWSDKGIEELPEQTSDIDYSKLPIETLKQLLTAKKDETKDKS